MSPARETGKCSCHEHQSADRLREIIKEKDVQIKNLQSWIDLLRLELEAQFGVKTNAIADEARRRGVK